MCHPQLSQTAVRPNPRRRPRPRPQAATARPAEAERVLREMAFVLQLATRVSAAMLLERAAQPATA